ncbi:S1 RNA-binding domain-containing protein 1-like [Leptodactylus fuscus]|uniref:S1 RNA-binding domain-containing protein 1-like n=1 Tax=Leptodactylus fuscus TaxID=238119 RepID=UPI003F4F3284
MSRLPRKARTTAAAPKQELSFLSAMSDSEEESKDEDEWMPEEKPTKKRSTAAKTTVKKTAAKPKPAAAPRPRKVTAKKTTKASKAAQEAAETAQDNEVNMSEPSRPETISLDKPIKKEKTPNKNLKSPKTQKTGPKLLQVKEERRSVGIEDFPSTSSLDMGVKVKNEFPSKMEEDEPPDDFTFGGPPVKKLKVSADPAGKVVKYKANRSTSDGCDMNWDVVEVLSERTNVEPWVCNNLIQLFQDENTIPFIARYRKELINNLDADALREVQQSLEELRSVAKKAHTLIEKLKKEGKLNSSLHTAMLNCRSMDEVEHVYTPYKTGSKGTKAQRARQLGLEDAAKALIETPQQLNLHKYIKPNTEGLSTLQDVEMGVQHILADMVAKDKDTLEHIRKLCKQNYVALQSSLAKSTGKEKEGNTKDVDKFHLYHNFTCSISRIQHHQILAINRGENLKVLTVKVNVPDRVKEAFCRWCVNERWRPKQFARPEFMKILNNSVEDSYKRLIYPLLCREYRSKLTSDAEKESIMMFGRNLRQLLLANPVRGRIIMGVDPGYKHGCKLAVISATNQILHTDVVYLHTGHGRGMQEAEKIRHLLLKFNCYTVAIGNGTACRETEKYFADLIQRKFFSPLNVVYWVCLAASCPLKNGPSIVAPPILIFFEYHSCVARSRGPSDCHVSQKPYEDFQACLNYIPIEALPVAGLNMHNVIYSCYWLKLHLMDFLQLYLIDLFVTNLRSSFAAKEIEL